jgi:hypothetical protein
MSRVQVPSLTPRYRAPDLRKRRSGALSLPGCPPAGGVLGGSLGGSCGAIALRAGARTVEPVNVPTQPRSTPACGSRPAAASTASTGAPARPAPRRPSSPSPTAKAELFVDLARRGQPVGGAGVRARPPAGDPARAARHGAVARTRADPGPVHPGGGTSAAWRPDRRGDLRRAVGAVSAGPASPGGHHGRGLRERSSMRSRRWTLTTRHGRPAPPDGPPRSCPSEETCGSHARPRGT